MNIIRGTKRADIADIGVYSILTNNYCIVHTDSSERVFSNFESELGDIIPIVHTSLCGSASIGCLAVGNSKGLVVPDSVTDLELRHLTNGLPDGVKVMRVDERLGALGNNVVCNDGVALVHPELDRVTVDAIEDALQVDVIPGRVAGESLVGSYLALSNRGALAHPRTSVQELDELNALLQVPVAAGSVNRGGAFVGKGCVVNDFFAAVGKNTTSSEIGVIETVFQLITASDNGDSSSGRYSQSMRSAIIENWH